MKYDFDMFSIIPDTVQSEFQEMFNRLGVNEMASQQLGLWRDPKVVESLSDSDEVVKQLFRDSGFGINHYSSGAPTGRYLKRDTAARDNCIMRFNQNFCERMQSGELQSVNWGGL